MLCVVNLKLNELIKSQTHKHKFKSKSELKNINFTAPDLMLNKHHYTDTKYMNKERN